ncbi:MAG: hypothetical protein LBM38_02875 [Clostridiales bacterium]|jgi:hypothetical protein|nr:hypothetical protein [Clostridiales bacterium]
MKCYIVIGHYGSGKSEVAINLAIHYKIKRIVDLDIVNPYFRLNDAYNVLEKNNIEVISSQFAGTNADLPSLPHNINRVFDANDDVVFDVGGDDVGARVLGRFREEFAKMNCQVMMVVNTRRPETSDANMIIKQANEIEAACGLKISYLINNTNLMNESTEKMLENSRLIFDEVPIPLLMTTTMIPNIPDTFLMKRYLTQAI